MLSRPTFNFKLSTFNRSGFTLLELLVVLAIMALLTGMSAPAISGYLRGARLRGGARQIASTLRTARQLAITKRADHMVVFDSIDRQFWVKWSDGIGGYNLGEIHTLPDTIDFFTSPLLFSFTARGTGTSGSIRIEDPHNNRMKIEVTGATGRVRVDHWSP